MNNEQFKKANEIKEELDALITHRNSVKVYTKDEDNKYDRCNFTFPLSLKTVRNNSFRDEIQLMGTFISIDEFLMVYLMKVNAKIDQLQKEFDSL